MTTDEQLHADLRAVKETLLGRGWCQKHAEQDDGSVCIGGAINLITLGNAQGMPKAAWVQDERKHNLHVALIACIHGYNVPVGNHVPLWNDRPERTFEEVIDLIDRTIAIVGARITVPERELETAR